MKKLCLLIFAAIHFISFPQIKGTITDNKGIPISSVNIYIKDTYISTTTNDQGKYELSIKKSGTHTIVFQFLGFKTQRKTINTQDLPQNIDIILEEESISLDEVVISNKINPAIEIIKSVIKSRKANSDKAANYTADFYSKGIFRVKNLPKKILGQKIDFFDEMIDSTRSGILYLSETVSKITYQKPDKLKEVIVASKVSGDDNGFSFNSAASADIDFYQNNVTLNEKLISPISDHAFNYYKYKFDGTFTDENNKIINKIKVIPIRMNEPVMSGYIYVVDDSWAIYGVELTVDGVQMQTPELNSLTLKQNFIYNNTSKVWIKNTQTIDFEAGFLGLKMNGKFTHVYSNFDLLEKIEKKTFTAEILRFEENANKKEQDFWNTIRPVPLTLEESSDYLKKDAIQLKKKSKAYLDSIDAKKNKFKITNLISSYSYNNSFQKWNLRYLGPIFSTSFNTVQGWNSSIGIYYIKTNEEKRTYTQIGSRFNYGFSENKLRGTFSFVKKLNNYNNGTLSLNGGSEAVQFNQNNPISDHVNTVSTLFFTRNFKKIFEKNFISASLSRELINGLNLYAKAEYAERKPLWNATDQKLIKSDRSYTSNNPVLPFDFSTPGFEKHQLVKTNLNLKIHLGQKYMTRPDGKFNIPDDKYPTISFNYEKGFAGSKKEYEFDHISARLTHDLAFGNKGTLQANINAGTFFNASAISFVDYKHFNGNQTQVSSGNNYTKVFNNLPYYTASTNNRYFEMHLEHNDKGYLMNKIPLLNKLQSKLVLGFHNLAIPNKNPYQEYTVGLDNLGFGKYKLIRLDYIRSYQNGFQGDAVIFGFKFLNIFDR